MLATFGRAARMHNPLSRLFVVTLLATSVSAMTAIEVDAARTAPRVGGGPTVGVACTTWVSRDSGLSRRLGNRLCRVEFDIAIRAQAMDPVIGSYARAGIRVQLLAGFHGRLPTEREARNLGSWAARFGPKGVFWKNKDTNTRMPVLKIEFGNETSYGHQYDHTGTWSSSPELAARARVYALLAKTASIALADSGIGLLVQADDGGAENSVWVDQMFAAVPDLATRTAGWTVHPYGENGFARIDRMLAQLAAQGAPATVPIFITEWGLATANGRRLNDNYGYPTDMTYAEAAATLRWVMKRWKSAYGSRIASVIYYMLTDLGAVRAPTDRERHFGALTADGSPKGQYTLEVRAQIEASAK